MNNTTIDGARQNQFEVSALTSLALKWYPTPNPWYVRAQYNNSWVPASFHSNALLLGLGRDFSYEEDQFETQKLDVDVSFWGGSSRTTQVGDQHTAIGYEIEAKFHITGVKGFEENLAYSIGFLSEGDTNLVDRRGVPVRLCILLQQGSGHLDGWVDCTLLGFQACRSGHHRARQRVDLALHRGAAG